MKKKCENKNRMYDFHDACMLPWADPGRTMRGRQFRWGNRHNRRTSYIIETADTGIVFWLGIEMSAGATLNTVFPE